MRIVARIHENGCQDSVFKNLSVYKPMSETARSENLSFLYNMLVAYPDNILSGQNLSDQGPGPVPKTPYGNPIWLQLTGFLISIQGGCAYPVLWQVASRTMLYRICVVVFIPGKDSVYP